MQLDREVSEEGGIALPSVHPILGFLVFEQPLEVRQVKKRIEQGGYSFLKKILGYLVTDQRRRNQCFVVVF